MIEQQLIEIKNSSVIEGAPNITTNHKDKSNLYSVNPGDSLLGGSTIPQKVPGRI